MPPAKRSKTEIVQSWIGDHPELHFDITEGGIQCEVCDVKLSDKSKVSVSKHIISKAHKQKLSGKDLKSDDHLEPDNVFKSEYGFKTEFWYDLTVMIVCANLPFEVVHNIHFRSFFNKYCPSQMLPGPSAIKQSFLPKVYNHKMTQLRHDLNSGYFWTSIQETVDAKGRTVTHFLLRKADENQSSRCHLISSKYLDGSTGESVSLFFLTTLKDFWGDNAETNFKNIILLTSDSTEYMISCGERLKKLYPQIIHVICVAHALHRVSEEIKERFPLVTKLLTAMEAIFLKAPNRIKLFKTMLPNVPLPLQPATTGLKTWLSDCLYYYEHFDDIAMFVNKLTDQGDVVTSAKLLLDNVDTRTDLKHIQTKLSILVLALQKFEKSQLSLSETFRYLDKVQTDINAVTGATAVYVQNKFQSVINLNPELNVVRDINDALKLQDVDEGSQHLWKGIPYTFFRYLPLTAVDCKRSFSAFKSIYDYKRHRLTTSKMEQLLFIYFEASAVNVDEDEPSTSGECV